MVAGLRAAPYTEDRVLGDWFPGMLPLGCCPWDAPLPRGCPGRGEGGAYLERFIPGIS